MSGFSVTFLGTGTSVGVPAIGCRCPVCLSDDPRNKRARCSIWLRAPGLSVVVDTGPDFRHQCLRAGLDHLEAAVFTHPHSDHIMGFDDLRRHAYNLGGKMPVYALPETLNVLRRCFPYAFDPALTLPGYLTVEEHPVLGPFRIGKMEVVPVPVTHGRVVTTGYLFRYPGAPSVGYFSDVKAFPSESMKLLEGVDWLILDGLRERPHETHLDVEEALSISEALGKPRTWLTHFCCEIDHATLEAKLPPHAAAAYDTLTLQAPCES